MNLIIMLFWLMILSFISYFAYHTIKELHEYLRTKEKSHLVSFVIALVLFLCSLYYFGIFRLLLYFFSFLL